MRAIGVICQPGYTIADGIAVKHPGELPSSILERVLDDTVQVSDDEISEALVLCVERTKLLVEGAGAVGLAALLAGRMPGNGIRSQSCSPAATSTRRRSSPSCGTDSRRPGASSPSACSSRIVRESCATSST